MNTLPSTYRGAVNPWTVYREEHTRIHSENDQERPRLPSYLNPQHTQIPAHPLPRHGFALQRPPPGADMLPTASSGLMGVWGGILSFVWPLVPDVCHTRSDEPQTPDQNRQKNFSEG